jgi:uncharacterized protein YraI
MILVGVTMLVLSASLVLAQESGVNILVNRDGVNVRLFPAIGAEVLGFVDAGFRAPATARSPDNEWVRIDFNGQEAWIGLAVINVFGDLNSLPVADPRTIPYGGFESPRAGLTSADSAISGRLAQSGLRVRAGPSRAYPVLANAPRYTVMPLLGRTANNAWLQVNFEGTLGWVATPFVELQGGASIIQLPIDGIVAEGIQPSQPVEEDYLGTLRFMLDRVELAQPSLDSIRATWTSIALGEFVACGGYPTQPSNYSVPNPLLAAFYPTLFPVQNLFNDAMTNVRDAIDLWIDVCQQPQPDRGVVGRARVIGALETVNAADAQFAELRRRINELLPPPIELGENQCLFTFRGASEVLDVIQFNTVVRDTLEPGNRVTGFCFDATAGQSVRIQVLEVEGNTIPLLAVSPLDNPTNFIGNARGTGGAAELLILSPVTIPQTGRYLLILADDDPARQEPLTGDLALAITDITGVTTGFATLQLDQTTGEPILFESPLAATSVPLATATPGAVICPSLTFTCQDLTSCEQAQACYAAGNFTLDPDGNGIPCANLCPGG